MDERIRKGDVQRTVRRMREAYERDPERFAGLKMLLEAAPGPGYDPEVEPEHRTDEEPDA